MNKYVVVLSTAGSARQAQRIAKLLLKRKVAGCVNLIPRIDSWYWWQGRIEHGKEFLLVIKTSSRHLNELGRLLKANHSYQTPELIALPIQWGDRSYLGWLDQTL